MENTALQKTEGEVLDTNSSAIDVLINCVSTESRADKIKLINALDSADRKLVDMIGQEIVITGIYAETHFSQKKNKQVCRVLILDNQGVSYATGSFVFLNSLRSIIDVLGVPSQAEPLKIQVTSQKMENGEALKAKVVE